MLESIASLPESEAKAIYRDLDVMELEIARAATPARGARTLLEVLNRNGAMLGIVTRNSRANALETLRACGLASFFDAGVIVGRDEAEPKPSPDGIHYLLGYWDAGPHQAVMVGDFLFDLQAGRAAGVATVHVDVSGEFAWREHADTMIRDLHELLHRADGRTV